MKTRRVFTRRRVLGCAGATAAALLGARLAAPRVLAPDGSIEISDRARALVSRCFAGLDRSRVWDVHAHLVGLGAQGTGCAVNPQMQSLLSPFRRLQYDVYMAAAGIGDATRADGDYLQRLLRLHRAANPAGKLVLLAFDRHLRADGTEAPELSPFFVPNEYLLAVAAQHEDVKAGVSIHPYRTDAVERLDKAVEAGAAAVKWLPNAMGIDPASPQCDPFYRRLAEVGLPLITHTGHEGAVESGDHQAFGNPLRLRRALDAGVRVVAAHCASLGEAADLDDPASPPVPAFDLLMRMFGERQYDETLFADVSAVTFVNRSPRVLRTLLSSTEIHHRLVYGSDYPLPAIDILVSTRRLARHGFIPAEDRPALNELWNANPLLFDFAVKRSLTCNLNEKSYRWPTQVFETSRLFGA